MNRLMVPVAIFVSVLAAGKVCEHLGLSASWTIGISCLVAMLVTACVNRYQRR
ncbi:hypothetical protein IAE35_18485 [Pseudomonas sp. S75]|uniref:hypothetical protein n=1 Tax=unclassified Pseudomonas TaxID=196821 RepID=UPI0019071D7A|nr:MULTISPECIES: hypothetical protein [unclassified Pseudomonas]MBJ9977767.1 hypothetical protein [Pseudomonas sp. S30]MBK0155334.1 hypothetical protein [Pseudomonas sp. S75]